VWILLVELGVLVFAAETVVDLVCIYFPKLTPIGGYIMDMGALAVLLVPAFYFLILRDLNDRIDLIEREYAESRIRVQELAAIVQATEECVLVTGLDGVIKYVNPSWEKTTGWSASEVVGKVTPRILKSGKIDPAVYENLWKTITRGESFRRDLTNRRKDGSLYEVESIIAPLADAAGKIVGYAGIERDITERTRLAAVARENEENRRLAEDAAQMGMWSRDISGDRTYWSEIVRKQLGAGAEVEPSYENFIARVHRDDRERLDRAVRISIETRGPYAEEFRCSWPDGSVHWFAASGRGYYDGAGRAIRMAGITLDITARKLGEEKLRQTEAQLRQSQKMESIGSLAGGIAHDFNNLLSVISGCTYFLLESAGRDDPKRPDIEEIKRAGDRAAALTRQLLAFSRKQVLEPKVIELNACVRELERMLRRIIGEDIRLAADLRGTGRVSADPGQIDQIVMNLAVNARDAMPGGGVLSISVGDAELGVDDSHPGIPAGRYQLLSVGDTGTGMEPAVLARIFEPFFTTKETGKGTGLGLATVYGIVKQSGGGIYVDSAPGRGSVFRIYFPQVDAEAESPSNASTSSSPVRCTETILLVDDDTSVRSVIRRMLVGKGYSLLEAGSPEEAVRLGEGHRGPIDLLLTDVVMPGMRGDALAKRLRSSRPEMKILFMSGYSDWMVARADLDGAGQDFIQKPVEPGVLSGKIRALLEEPELSRKS
jgi:PAS domain S-box-containing protein